jgi:hypothetical protein
MVAKAQAWLAAGTRLVWEIWSGTQRVDVRRLDIPCRPVQTRSLSDHLDGLDVLPGFTSPLVDLVA